jgi:hypothetical protein
VPPVLHLDDLAGHGAFFDWTGRLTEQVLTPLSQGRTAHYAAYDWARAAFPQGAHSATFPQGAHSATPLPPAPVVLVEGVGAGRRALRSHLACLLWTDMAAGDAWHRGRERDGSELAEFWDAWTHAETAHFAGDSSYSSANFVVRQGESWDSRCDRGLREAADSPNFSRSVTRWGFRSPFHVPPSDAA